MEPEMTDTKQEMLAAIQAGEIERVRALAAQDPSAVRVRDENGVSALLVAMYHGQKEIFELLLDLHPELDLFEAAAAGRVERANELLDREPELARAWSGDGFTALHLACFFGHPECARLLLEAGADPNAESRNPVKLRPINSAAARRNQEAVRHLLEHGADIEAAQAGGYTALHSAAHNGDADLVKLLLSKGANRDAKSDDGKTPLEMAEADGHAEVVRLLES